MKKYRLPWCPVHGDVTACPCRPANKRFYRAISRNQPYSHVIYVTSSGAVQLRELG